ncbi:8-oxoguanine deaminase [Caulifigura coniformis]|uniref:8-oxoguanine deaminase n=1 Tax=Caulifigura coniformis TaxID=2527983 RepID=A0A517SBF2_9PLAN|nr:8-oxoguanine deaminase [Caulifigura coniformis]
MVEIADGQVVALHDCPQDGTIDLGSAVIVPGLVNTHTHLEFSNLERPLGPPAPFADWIGSVVAERRRRCRREEDSSTAPRLELDPISLGLQECFQSGSSLVADIVTGSLEHVDRRSVIVDALANERLLPFRELIAPTPAGIEATWSAAETSLAELEPDPERRRAGLSPHAPYTVAATLLEQAIARAGRESRPVAMHLAETQEELDLLSRHSGPLVDMLKRIGVWDPSAPAGTRPLDILKRLSVAPRVLVIHGNFLEEDELRFLGNQRHMSLVYCPRTHAYFGHPTHPLRAAIDLGVNVALGTDSRASNPDLNLWEEAKQVASEFPMLPAAVVLQMATANGARALGRSATHGVIAPGRSADLCCIRPGDGSSDPLRAALAPSATVVGAMHAGEWLLAP